MVNSVVAVNSDVPPKCTLDDVEVWRDFTTMYSVDESGEPMEVVDDTSGDFKLYYCRNCERDWSKTILQPQEQAWALVKEHLDESF